MLRSELSLEEGRPDDAYDDMERALAQAAGTDDESFTPEICSLGIRALADQFAQAQQQRRRFDDERPDFSPFSSRKRPSDLWMRPGSVAGRLCRRLKPLPCSVGPKPHVCRVRTTACGRPQRPAGRSSARGTTRSTASCVRPRPSLPRSAPARAAKCLRRAWRIAVEIGAAPLQAKTEAIAQRARVTWIPKRRKHDDCPRWPLIWVSPHER